MNLNAYDDVKEQVNKNKTWINVKKKTLITREIKYRKVTLLSKRYNTALKCYDYFIIMLDDEPLDRNYSITNRDDYGRIKIRLTSIWADTILSTLDTDCNINVTHIDHADDGDVYQLDI